MTTRKQTKCKGCLRDEIAQYHDPFGHTCKPDKFLYYFILTAIAIWILMVIFL